MSEYRRGLESGRREVTTAVARERARIVAWLRAEVQSNDSEGAMATRIGRALADLIESGDDLGFPTPDVTTANREQDLFAVTLTEPQRREIANVASDLSRPDMCGEPLRSHWEGILIACRNARGMRP